MAQTDFDPNCDVVWIETQMEGQSRIAMARHPTYPYHAELRITDGDGLEAALRTHAHACLCQLQGRLDMPDSWLKALPDV